MPVENHEPLAEALPRFPGLRHDVLATLLTSEPAGELGPALTSAADTYAEVESNLRVTVTKVAAGTLYAVVVLYVAVKVIGFYADYFGGLGL